MPWGDCRCWSEQAALPALPLPLLLTKPQIRWLAAAELLLTKPQIVSAIGSAGAGVTIQFVKPNTGMRAPRTRVPVLHL